MTENQIQKTYKKAFESILKKQLHEGIRLIKSLLEKTSKLELKDNFEKLLQTYSFLLEYTFKGISDPQRPSIYKDLQVGLLELLEKLRIELMTENSQNRLFIEKKILKQEESKTNISVSNLLNQIVQIRNSEKLERKTLLNRLFLFIWLSDKYQTEDLEFLRKLSKLKKIKVHEKSTIVSALTISLLQSFNEKKLHSLFDFYDAGQQMVWNRALVGLVLVLFHHKKQLQLYPKIESRIKLLLENKEIEKQIEIILIQLLKTKETKEISEKLLDEIIPEVAKFKPKMTEKLDLEKILSDKSIEDFNPDWEEIFDDAPDLLNKMQEFSEMQLSGSDVFMSAFSGLKHFPFFDKAINWFIPFYKENADIKTNNFANEAELLEKTGEGLENSLFMCNSDKYSFFFNLDMAPAAQRNMIVEIFKMESEQFKEIDAEDKLLNKGNDDKYIFTRYIQDLYRFFNLHPWRKDFHNILEGELDVHDSILVNSLESYNDILLTLAELSFSKKYYKEAVSIFMQADLKQANTQRIFEKIAFAYQKLKDYKNALKYYQYAELLDEESQWLMKKIAFCYRKLNEFEKAIMYYKKAEIKEPENLHIQANIAHALLYSEKYDEAFKHYQKVEYFDPNNIKVMRPLAWCAFVLDKHETAAKYFRKLLEIEPTAYDYINLGHVLLCSKQEEEAIIQYKNAIRDIGIESVIESILEDKKVLSPNKMEELDFYLLLDYLKLKE